MEQKIMKWYLFYVRQYSIFTNDYELYIYRCFTFDPFHTMGEILYCSLEHIEEMFFEEMTQNRLDYWKQNNYDISEFLNKY